MREFFRPFRHKLGVVTLVVTCAFMGLWIRSYSVDDYLMKGGGRRTDGSKHYFDLWQVISADGTFYCSKLILQSTDPTEFDVTEQNYRWPRWRVDPDADFAAKNAPFEWRFMGFGFYWLPPKDPINGSRRLLIPHWSVVMPLTALSAWLLLSKPRPKLKVQADHA